ncbi:hypothetical protein PILCRDRAFT_822965 [Piloderma croceum F 1598]|uniref:Uncharacterized protein n=1 Tax=Piloderma croceum (strain F 1598) TaxID=765440 RepID=A0A0C3BR48_PILCF|nr:hypothetical protein PILCRDRAFT_822965 [Piloderma croceum F 1598]
MPLLLAYLTRWPVHRHGRRLRCCRVDRCFIFKLVSSQQATEERRGRLRLGWALVIGTKPHGLQNALLSSASFGAHHILESGDTSFQQEQALLACTAYMRQFCLSSASCV